MNRAGDDFLTNPALASNENLRVRASDAIDLLLQGSDFGATAGQLDVRTRSERPDWADPRAAAFSDTINHCS